MLTVFGVTALSFMMVMYTLERRDRRFVLLFACGCLLSSAYGFLAGTWPFGVVEAVWAVIAVGRFQRLRSHSRNEPPAPSAARGAEPEPVQREFSGSG